MTNCPPTQAGRSMAQKSAAEEFGVEKDPHMVETNFYHKPFYASLWACKKKLGNLITKTTILVYVKNLKPVTALAA